MMDSAMEWEWDSGGDDGVDVSGGNQREEMVPVSSQVKFRFLHQEMEKVRVHVDECVCGAIYVLVGRR